MKVKDLIAELQKCDPEAFVDMPDGALCSVELLPGYYDGSYQVIIEDASKKPYYSAVGMKFSTSGEKVCLKTMTYEDIVWECSSEEELNALVFEFEGVSEFVKNSILKKIETTKAIVRSRLKRGE